MAHLGAGQHDRPYALRSLLTAHRTHDRDTDARAMAASLIADFPLTEHALTGLAQEVELALDADDLPVQRQRRLLHQQRRPMLRQAQ